MTASLMRSRTGPTQSPHWTEPERNLPLPVFCTQISFQTPRSRQTNHPHHSGRTCSSNYPEPRRRARGAPSAPAMIALPIGVIHYAPVHRLPRRRVYCGPDRSRWRRFPTRGAGGYPPGGAGRRRSTTPPPGQAHERIADPGREVPLSPGGSSPTHEADLEIVRARQGTLSDHKTIRLQPGL